ncbi:MAG: response regulator transcription factor [Clostridia bacterium]|nr:response regulator transcription factor [Clostridia bacterium]
MIYFVEDDNNIRELVVYTLNNSGMEAVGFGLPSEFWRAMEKQIPSLIMLDIMLPDEDGLSILKKLRSMPDTKKTPIMMITAKDSEYDKVVGLDLGADDYVPKPFGMMELIARVKALLRRTETNREKEYTIGNLYVCPSKHIVRVDGNDVVLTLKEFEMLCMLLKSGDIVLTRDTLLNEIWGYSFDGENRTVDVHIRTLRQKLGTAGDYIKTVRGMGYKIGGANHEA